MSAILLWRVTNANLKFSSQQHQMNFTQAIASNIPISEANPESQASTVDLYYASMSSIPNPTMNILIARLPPSFLSQVSTSKFLLRRSTDPRPQRGEPLGGGGRRHRRRRHLQRFQRRGRKADAAGSRPLFPLAEALDAADLAGGGDAAEDARHRPLLPHAEGLLARRDQPFLQGETNIDAAIPM